MRALGTVAGRLQRADLLQVTALTFAVLVVALNVNWPDGGARVNEAWGPVVALRNSLLALLALAYAVGIWGRAAPGRLAEARVTFLALVAVAVLTWPFEASARAATYPAVPGYWPALVAFLTLGAYFGLGLLVGRALRGRYAGVLTFIAVPVVLALVVWLDVSAGGGHLNPWSAPSVVSPAYLAWSLPFALVGAFILWRPGRGSPGGPTLAGRDEP
ncbi:MAG: hypothetical protein IT345_06570 [Trueperaceae bacterium]|nr:hypothetical protein [Trueperaceae bacterium]